MTTKWFQKLTLGAADLAAFGIGVAILTVPASFYRTYCIDLGRDPMLFG